MKYQLRDFVLYRGYSTVFGLVNTPNVVDNSLSFNLGAGTNFGTDWAQCEDSCLRSSACAAYTAFTNVTDQVWYGQCYGRSSVVSILRQLNDPTVYRSVLSVSVGSLGLFFHLPPWLALLLQWCQDQRMSACDHSGNCACWHRRGFTVCRH